MPDRSVLIPQLADLVPQVGHTQNIKDGGDGEGDEKGGVKFKVDLSGKAHYSIIVECVKCLGGIGVVVDENENDEDKEGAYGRYKRMNYGEFVGERGFGRNGTKAKNEEKT